MTRKKVELILPDYPDLSFESELWNRSYRAVAGIDEAGRGPWAGPVSAGAVILPRDSEIQIILKGVNDSKKLTHTERVHLTEIIQKNALAWGVGMATVEEIDSLGIAPATRLAAVRALELLKAPPDHLLIDYFKLPESDLPQTSLVKGDARSLSIAAASILAKTARDAWMAEAEQFYPGYGFARHKGYGTALHQECLRRLGPSVIHRKSFKPIAILANIHREENTD